MDVRHPDRRPDEGSVLILALVYLCAVGVAILSLTGWVAGSLRVSTGFSSVREEQLAASSTAEFALQSMRYTPLLSTTQNASPPSYCWGSGTSTLTLDGYSMTAWCSTVWNATSAATRIVTVSVCPSTATATSCAAAPYLKVLVTYDDYPPGGAAPVQGPCTDWGWCGQGQTIDNWIWG